MFDGLFQPMHLFVLLIIALFVFGPKRLPELGKAMGEGIRSFRSGMKELPGREDRGKKPKLRVRLEHRAALCALDVLANVYHLFRGHSSRLFPRAANIAESFRSSPHRHRGECDPNRDGRQLKASGRFSACHMACSPDNSLVNRGSWSQMEWEARVLHVSGAIWQMG